jgi:hypothetical protein
MTEQFKHSHSTLKDFATCPHKYFRTKVLKDVVVDYGDKKQNWGTQVHEALEYAIKHGAPMPSNMTQYQPVVDNITQFNPHVKSEFYLGVDRNFQPTPYKQAWLRAILDTVVIVPSAPTAILTDFKTGKRWLDWQQHDIGALLLFSTNPHVEKVNASYQWLAEENPAKRVDRKVYYREDLPELRATLLPLIERIEWSQGAKVYPKKAGPLCAYCSVRDCEFWKPRP